MAAPGTTQRLVEGSKRFWESMSTGRRMALGTLALFFAFAVAYAGYLGSTEDYATAFSGVEAKDAAAITAMLEKQNVPYRLSAGGTVIKVPEAEQHRVRLMAAGEGVVGDKGGYELFDEPRFGMTPFEMRMNYKRALEGELRRTINSIDEIKETRIHIVLPKKGTFREDDQEATASVVLTLGKGRAVDKAQVRGIVNLVAASVEGLTPQSVTVVDQGGKVLSAPGDPLMAGSMNVMEARAGLERQHEKRLLELLGPALGAGNVRVRVTADVDFRKIERVDETYDPKVVPRSKQTRTEQGNNINQQAQGVPGARGNAPGAAPGAGKVQNGGSGATSESINYEVSSKITRTDESGEEIKRLNVAVLVNGSFEGEGEERKYVPRTDEEMSKIEGLVKGSVGFDSERGDSVVVSNMPFLPIDQAPVESPGFMLSPDIWKAVRYALVLLMALLMLLFIVRPLVKAVTRIDPNAQPVSQEDEADVEDGEFVSDTVTQGAEATPGATGPNPRVLSVAYASENPRKAAQILRVWLLEDADQSPTLGELAGESRKGEPAHRA